MEIYYNKAAKHQMKQQIRYQRGKKVMQWCSLNYWVIGEIFPVCIRMRAWWADVRQYSWKLFCSCMYMFWRIDLFCWLFLFFPSAWMRWIGEKDYISAYGASALLGVGGSTLLVTALTMLADLIGENVVNVVLFGLIKILVLHFFPIYLIW